MNRQRLAAIMPELPAKTQGPIEKTNLGLNNQDADDRGWIGLESVQWPADTLHSNAASSGPQPHHNQVPHARDASKTGEEHAGNAYDNWEDQIRAVASSLSRLEASYRNALVSSLDRYK